ncbi:MAG: hypothetical protein HY597_00960 [Candidatus Omnitrophica bacterium]|nr:hypothetical protein [Candidatus Omnitrophota bacterium]
MLATIKRTLGPTGRQAVRRLMLLTGRHWANPSLVGRGTIQDLYYWVADEQYDTVVLLNNFFSALFPAIPTATTGTMTLFDSDGRQLGREEVAVSHLGCAKWSVGRSVQTWARQRAPAPTFGTALFTLTIPPAVLEAVAKYEGPFYFWHRFYIEYVTRAGWPAFVHCVDKTWTFRHGRTKPIRWYRQPPPRDWAPEIPLNIQDYRRVLAIVTNRTVQPATMTLTVTDGQDRAREFSTTVPPFGVRRFELTAEALRGLAPQGLRLRLLGLPTTWARPVLFKEFRNGTISAMHC